MSVPVSLPVDTEGFLRRACATCAREFKILDSDDDASEDEPDAPPIERFCPYCRAEAEDWITPAQLEWAIAKATNEALRPVFDEFEESVQAVSSDFVQIEVSHSAADVEELLEPNDMERVEFECHPGDPLKVLGGWAASVHCHECGEPR